MQRGAGPLTVVGARPRDERGASALEMAFIAPSLIFLIFFSIQGALFFYGRNVALQSAREGVSHLRLAGDRESYEAIRGQIEAGTAGFARNVGREALISPTVTSSYDEDAGRVSVTVTGDVITLVPFLELSTTQRAEGPVERFEGDSP